ncbi:MAG: alanine--glyoxylate aminotransferase family protein, partial [bacterium]|nr:alanine--glyoxylate aminotransferase family protein [bacterium]
MAYKLFIPGPTEVNEEVREKMSVEMMGHRSKTFSVLYDQVSSKLKKMLGTQNRVFLSTSSALGVMEACVRNLVKNKSLNLVCGAFSDRWYKMVGECGKQADKIEVE